MKRARSIFLAVFVVISFYMLIPSTAHASDGGGRHVVKVVNVNVNLNLANLKLKPLSPDQLKALRNRPYSHVALASPNAVAANACAAVPNDRNCDGQDPVYQGCSPSAENAAKSAFNVNLGWGWLPIGQAYLRYSADCQSNWAHGYSGYEYYDGNYYTYYFDLIAVKVVRDDGLTEEYDQTTDTEGWSNMVYAPVRKTKACILIDSGVTYPGGGGHGSDIWYCTGFY